MAFPLPSGLVMPGAVPCLYRPQWGADADAIGANNVIPFFRSFPGAHA